MKTNFHATELRSRSRNTQRRLNLHLSNQRSFPESLVIDNLGEMGLYLWIYRSRIAGFVHKDEVFPPGEIIPKPNEPEILPDPSLPEEEEYLPDEDENPLESPRREVNDPYQPDREKDFPPDKEPEWPQQEPKKRVGFSTFFWLIFKSCS
ncbi:hypothetical protein [Algoriphagus resistens]|uniref:hypothetical protein n=1 Tax=Algoriphagus resistens TaxID=1750590 RepID=UPI000716A5C1|nr:hypothetical protein [Algoriphagus resistens]